MRTTKYLILNRVLNFRFQNDAGEVSLSTVLPWLNLLPNSAVEWGWFLFTIGNNEYVNLKITLVCLVILKSGLCALAWHTLYIRQAVQGHTCH